MLVFTAIFSMLFGRTIENYPVYFLSGRLIYDFYNSATKGAMKSIKSNAYIIKKIYVPKYMFSISAVCYEFINFLISFVILESVLRFAVANVKKVLKIFIMSSGLSSSLIFTLMIVNVIMKISIDFNIYLLLFSVLTVAFTLGLTLFNSKKIFMKKKVKKSSNNNKTRKVKNVDYRINVRKKIS